jgi:hypothetical protein
MNGYIRLPADVNPPPHCPFQNKNSLFSIQMPVVHADKQALNLLKQFFRQLD